MQKIHPSTYGTWKKIALDDNLHTNRTEIVSPVKFPAAEAEQDVDLKKLDQILRGYDEKPQPDTTYEEDHTLEALESMISDIKRKSTARKNPEPVKKNKETPYEDIISLLKKDDRINLEELEKQIFGSRDDAEDDSIEGIENEYLKVLEQRYEKEKK